MLVMCLKGLEWMTAIRSKLLVLLVCTSQRLTVQHQRVDIKECSAFPYRAVIGSLLYLSVGTRPDLAFTVSYLSRFLANPGIPPIKAAQRVLRYIRLCPDLGICYTAAGGYGPGSAAVSASFDSYCL